MDSIAGMLDAIIASFITILSFSKIVHRAPDACCISTQSNCCSAKLSTSFLLSHGSTDYEIYGVI